MMRTYSVVQECHSCGAHFRLEYCENGACYYIDYPCKCEAELSPEEWLFSPVDGEPTLREWLESITH